MRKPKNIHPTLVNPNNLYKNYLYYTSETVKASTKKTQWPSSISKVQ